MIDSQSNIPPLFERGKILDWEIVIKCNSNRGLGSIGILPVLTKLPLSTYCSATSPIGEHDTWEGNTCEKIFSVKYFKFILYYKLLLKNKSIEKKLSSIALSAGPKGNTLGLSCAKDTFHCVSLLSSWCRFNLLVNSINNKVLQLFMNKV